MGSNYGSKSPSNRRYGPDHEQHHQTQHQSRRKKLGDQQEYQFREHHSSYPSSSRNTNFQGGYLSEQQVEMHRLPEGVRGRHSQHRSLSATRGAGNKSNHYHQSASWVGVYTPWFLALWKLPTVILFGMHSIFLLFSFQHTTNLQHSNTSKNGDVLRKSNELYYVGEFYG